jgi:hypothetical protein
LTSPQPVCDLDDTLHATGIDSCFAEVKDPVQDKLKRFGLFTRGEPTFFATLGEVASAYLATHSVEWIAGRIARHSARCEGVSLAHQGDPQLESSSLLPFPVSQEDRAKTLGWLSANQKLSGFHGGTGLVL